ALRWLPEARELDVPADRAREAVEAGATVQPGDPRLESAEMREQQRRVALVVGGRELARVARRALDDVGEADAMPREQSIHRRAARRELFADELRCVQRFPEAILRPREREAGARGVDRGVDADREDVEPGADPIG